MTERAQNAEMENTVTCLQCGGTQLDMASREVEFDHGGRDKPFRVKATFPFITCRQCGFVSVDGVDEDLQHEAACRHLGVMTPAEIRALRDKIGLTQKDLAELTGFGVASISRWEGGVLIQNEACDRLLYLLTIPENVERLRRREARCPENPPRAASDRSPQVNRVFPRAKLEEYAGVHPSIYVDPSRN